MAVSLPGDIVLQVERAADPKAAAAARARLVAKAGGGGEGETFMAASTPAMTTVTAARTHPAASPPMPEAYVKFEGMVLQTFLASIMPEGTESVYGEGMSGDMWKSMLAQTLGETMAERGGIGIASRLLGDRYEEDGKTVPLRGVDRSAARRQADQSDLASSALVDQIERETARALDGANGVFAAEGKKGADNA